MTRVFTVSHLGLKGYLLIVGLVSALMGTEAARKQILLLNN